MTITSILSVRQAIVLGRLATQARRAIDAREELDGRNEGVPSAARERCCADLTAAQDYLRELGGDAERAAQWMLEEDRLVREGAAKAHEAGHAQLLLARRLLRGVAAANRP